MMQEKLTKEYLEEALKRSNSRYWKGLVACAIITAAALYTQYIGFMIGAGFFFVQSVIYNLAARGALIELGREGEI